MKKITTLVFTLILSLVSLSLVACNGVNKAEEALKLLIVDQSAYVDADFQLAGTIMYEGVEYDLTWSSNNDALKISDLQVIENTDGSQTKYYVAQVNRPTSGEGEKITVTANLTIDGNSASKEFQYNVYPIDVYEVADAYKFSKANKVVSEAFDLETSTTYAGINATIEWSVHKDYEGVYTITNNKVEFNVEKETTVKISAKFTANGESTTKNYIVTLKPTEGAQPTIVSEAIAGKAFLFGVYQENLGKYLYFAGTTANKDYYMSTTEDASAATKVTAEAVEGGYHLSFVNPEGAKKYFKIVVSGSYVNVYIDDAATTVFTWDAEYNTFVAEVEGQKAYIGAYNTYNTLSCSKYSYISTSFPSHFFELPEQLKVVTAPVAGKAYKFGSVQESLGKTLFFAGKSANKDYYMETTEDAAASTSVVLEATDGGYYITFTDSEGNKKYLDVVVSGSYVNVYIKDKPAAVFTWDAEYNTLVTEVEGQKAYLGTYNTYTTLSCSKYSYISTSYPCHLYE